MVSVNTLNKGGDLKIWGTIVGRLIEQGGVTQIDRHASISTGVDKKP